MSGAKQAYPGQTAALMVLACPVWLLVTWVRAHVVVSIFGWFAPSFTAPSVTATMGFLGAWSVVNMRRDPNYEEDEGKPPLLLLAEAVLRSVLQALLVWGLCAVLRWLA